MNQLAEMVRAVVHKVIATEYPHLRLPAVLLARVTAAEELEVYGMQKLEVRSESTGEQSSGEYPFHWYAYNLTVLDRFGSPDSVFPALPQIRSRKWFQEGAVVAVALPYGELAPAIIGEVQL